MPRTDRSRNSLRVACVLAVVVVVVEVVLRAL